MEYITKENVIVKAFKFNGDNAAECMSILDDMRSRYDFLLPYNSALIIHIEGKDGEKSIELNTGEYLVRFNGKKDIVVAMKQDEFNVLFTKYNSRTALIKAFKKRLTPLGKVLYYTGIYKIKFNENNDTIGSSVRLWHPITWVIFAIGFVVGMAGSVIENFSNIKDGLSDTRTFTLR
jgi:hypothetical protein